tara:strand:+ start:618 stop:1820 length:1203 start_codon:yes stop_codon:yes gene_type:complete
MTLGNTTTHYGSLIKIFHWLTALLILTLIPLGWYAGQLPHETDAELATKAQLFSAHKTIGVATFLVALARIFWAAFQPRPRLLNADRKIESFVAKLVHWLLYGALVAVPLSGWIGHAASAGFAPIWWPFGQDLPLVPKSTRIEHLFESLHWISGRVLILSLFLHVAGALKHHIIDRDATLKRMLPGHANVPPLPESARHPAPLLAALALWSVAIGLATLSSAGPDQPTAVPTLTAVSSDWTVTQGSIEIGVTQFGSEVAGTFADWTAAITFDENAPGRNVGHVTTTISIPSLTLGSVTQQAMGADFFDADNHAIATYEADINRGNDGFVADGTLSLKGKVVPVSLPFHLSIDENTASLQTNFALDRRAFGIGANLKDESSLAFDVQVRIALTATRSTPAE